MRSRIRTKLTAQTFGKPVDLHRMNNDNLLKFNPENGTEVTLPVLALNEVSISFNRVRKNRFQINFFKFSFHFCNNNCCYMFETLRFSKTNQISILF